jgi:hypothetical protein
MECNITKSSTPEVASFDLEPANPDYEIKTPQKKLVRPKLQSAARYLSLVFVIIVAGAMNLYSQTDTTRAEDTRSIEDYEFVIDSTTYILGASDYQSNFTNQVQIATQAANEDSRIKALYLTPLVNVTYATDIVGSGFVGTDALNFHAWLLSHNCDTTNFWIFQTQNGNYMARTPTIGPDPNDHFTYTVVSQDYTQPLTASHESKGHGTGALLGDHVNGRINMTWQMNDGTWVTFSSGKTIGAAATGGYYIDTYTIPDAFNVNSVANGGDGYHHFTAYSQNFPARVAVNQCHNIVGETDVTTGIYNFYQTYPDRIRYESVDKTPVPILTVSGDSISISNTGDYAVNYPSTTDPNFADLNPTPEIYQAYLYSSDTTDGNFDQGPIPVTGSFDSLDEGTYYVRVYKVLGNSLSFVSQSATIDVTAPSSTMSGPGTANTSPVILTQEFSEPIDQSTLTTSDYSVDHGTATDLVFVNDSTVQITIEPNSGFIGDITTTLPDSSCTDLYGNGNLSDSFTFYYDSERPDPDQSSTEPAVTNATSFPANLDFSNEPDGVTGVEADDFWTENCSVSNVQGSGSNYTYTITPDGEGEIKTKYQENKAVDQANNQNIESEEFSRNIDWTNPDVNIHDNNPEIIGGGTYTAFIDFTESVNGFTIEDITVENATKSNFQTINSSSYSVDYTPIESGPLSLSVDNNKCEDEATNPNNASNVLEKTVNLDSPYSNMNSTAPYYTNADTIDVDIPFNKPVFEFEFSDLIFTNAEGAEFTQVNDSTWTVKAIPQEDGTFSIELPAGTYVDEFNNPGLADFFERISDKTRPQPIITGIQNDDGTFTITINFGEDVTDFTADDITLTNGAILSDFQGEGSLYTGIVTPAGQSCQVFIDDSVANDLALNPNLASDPYYIVIDGVLTHYNELKNFEIYPNPAKNFVKIKTEGDIRSVEVYDTNGKLVILDADKYGEDGAEVDVSKLAPGFYVISATVYIGRNKFVIQKKVIIQ